MLDFIPCGRGRDLSYHIVCSLTACVFFVVYTREAPAECVCGNSKGPRLALSVLPSVRPSAFPFKAGFLQPLDRFSNFFKDVLSKYKYDF